MTPLVECSTRSGVTPPLVKYWGHLKKGKFTYAKECRRRFWGFGEAAENTVREEIYDGRYNKKIATAKFSDFVDEQFLPWAKGNKLSYADDERRCKLLKDVFGNQPMLALNVGTGHISHVSFSPNGNYLVAACEDQTTRIWNVSDKQSVAVLRGHEKSVTYACFSPSGRLVLTSGTDRIAKLWGFGTNELLSVFAARDTSLTQASFSPDGRLITVADLKGVVNVYLCSICGARTKELLDLAENRRSRDLTTNERSRFLASN